MFKWKDKKYVNPRKKIFKNLDTGEILNLELQDDPDNILEESDTPLSDYCLNMAQQELVDDMSKTFRGTNITAETVKGAGIINKVRKACWQETREGYNLVDSNNLSLFNANKYVQIKNKIPVKKNTIYTLFSKEKFPDAQIKLYDDSNTETSTIISNFNTVRTFNSGNNTLLYFYLGGPTITYTNMTDFINKTQLMLVEGDYTASNIPQYEAFGASPSTEFPAKIHCLGDDKNLFDIDSHIEFKDGYRNKGSGSKVSSELFYGLRIPVEPKKEYVTSSDINTSGISNLCFFNEDMTFISGLAYNTADRTFTTPENCAYITLAIDKKFKWFKLQQGKVATPWSPFRFWYNSK